MHAHIHGQDREHGITVEDGTEHRDPFEYHAVDVDLHEGGDLVWQEPGAETGTDADDIMIVA